MNRKKFYTTHPKVWKVAKDRKQKCFCKENSGKKFFFGKEPDVIKLFRSLVFTTAFGKLERFTLIFLPILP
jgi:hypothetical protein